MDFSIELDFACTLARETGDLILEHHKKPLRIIQKEDGELSTHVDQLANDYLIEKLAERFPQDAILSEESHDDGLRHQASRVWIIDPIDGTYSFFQGKDDFAVHIALVVDGVPVVGVVCQPTMGATYAAEQGKGAFKITNDARVPLRVSARAALEQAHVVTGFFNRESKAYTLREQLPVAGKHTRSSMGIKMSLIAEGVYDFYFLLSSNSKEWDLCAPLVILHEAGGKVTDLAGKPVFFNKAEVRNVGGILASNGHVHDVALREIGK